MTDSLAKPTMAGSVAEKRCPHRAPLQPALRRRLSRLAGMLIPRRGRGKPPRARLVAQPEIGLFKPVFFGLVLASKKQKKKAVAAEAATAFKWIERVNRLRTG